jgi:DNA-binding response OmpR family regulator
MAFNALLMCREEHALRILGKALDEVAMEQEVCLSAPEALDLTVQRHYSALVIDFDLPGAATVARMARLAPSRRRPVNFGMIGARTEISQTFQAGANFIF